MSKKISQLPLATSLSGSDEFEVNTAGGTPSRRVPASLLRAFVGGTSWINVAAYGAVGDGTTDDTTAVGFAVSALNAAGGGVLYFPGPAKTYKTSGGFVFTANAHILGDGCGDALGAHALSTVTCTSATAKLFDLQQQGSQVENILLKNTAASTPTAGTAIYTTAGDGTRLTDVVVQGFYDNIDMQDGAEWHATRVFSYGPVRYGWRVRHVDLPDGGDWTIADSLIIAQTYNASSALRIESGGGGKISNLKINFRSSFQFVNGIDLAVTAGINTVVFLLTNSSIENTSGVPIKIACPSGATWTSLEITNCQTGLYGTVNANAIQVNAATLGGLNELIISNCIFTGSGSTTVPAIALTNINNAAIGPCAYRNHSALLTVSGCSNVRNDNARYGTATLVDAATVTPDPTNFENFAWTIGGNRTLGAPVALYSGQVIQIRVTQDATGGRTLTAGSGIKTQAGAGLTLAAAANAQTLISMQYDGNTTTWFANAGAYS